MTDLERTSLGTVPVFYAEGPPPFVGSLMFRVGRADEEARTCGLTHIVEHLTLPITGRRALDFNGSVDNILTSFWAAGDADLVLPFLADTAARLSSLPLERLETERNILLAEEAMQGPNPTRLAFALRFGPQQHGLTGYEEYGLRAIDAALPPETTIRMEPELTEKVDAVEEVAQASRKRRWLVDEELQLLPERLEEGESPLAFLWQRRAYAPGSSSQPTAGSSSTPVSSGRNGSNGRTRASLRLAARGVFGAPSSPSLSAKERSRSAS